MEKIISPEEIEEKIKKEKGIPKRLEGISKIRFEEDIKKEYKEEDGWFLTDKGFPDYVLFNKNTKQLIFYELKVNNHKFHNFQKQLMRILEISENRRGKVVFYNVDKKTKEILDVKEKNEQDTSSRGWEGVEDIGII